MTLIGIVGMKMLIYTLTTASVINMRGETVSSCLHGHWGDIVLNLLWNYNVGIRTQKSVKKIDKIFR